MTTSTLRYQVLRTAHINDLESKIRDGIKDLESKIKTDKENLRLISERIGQYVESEDVKLQFIKNKREHQTHLEEHQKRLRDLNSRLQRLQRAANAISARPHPRGHKGSSNRIQVIGWRGIEPPLLYEKCTFADSLAFLTTEMSFNTLPSLWFCPSVGDDAQEFNVIYVDFEFIERYSALDRIETFFKNDRITDICGPKGPLEPAVRRLVFNDAKHAARVVRCVPIQFGFNEILINKDGELGDNIIAKMNKGPSADWSYSDFHLDTLLADEKTKIAIWHWYIPSLTHILLTIWAKQQERKGEPEPELGEGDKVANHGEMGSGAKPVSLMERLKQVATWSEVSQDNVSLCKHLAAISTKMHDNNRYKERIMVCSSLSEVRDQALDEWRAGILLGIGSSVLSGDDYGNVEPVIPREGIPVWINCAAALHTQSKDVGGAADLIEYWVKDDTQLALFNESREYVGLPVNRRILEQLQNNDGIRQSCHALGTFAKVFRRFPKSNLPGGKFSGMIATRTFPRNVWTQWVGWWDSFVKESD